MKLSFLLSFWATMSFVSLYLSLSEYCAIIFSVGFVILTIPYLRICCCCWFFLKIKHFKSFVEKDYLFVTWYLPWSNNYYACIHIFIWHAFCCPLNDFLCTFINMFSLVHLLLFLSCHKRFIHMLFNEAFSPLIGIFYFQEGHCNY